MGNIKVLDCTLRDGGYCNGWEFGEKNIKMIIKALLDSHIDIIEYGYLNSKAIASKDSTQFAKITDLCPILSTVNSETMSVAMIDYGNYSISDIPPRQAHYIDGIRVAFHKKDQVAALELCKQIKEKGYKAFVQPMLTVGYTEQEFKNLIGKCNEIKPYAFYIVDSFGSMTSNDLQLYLLLVKKYLKKEIMVGLHTHNNTQASFLNAIQFEDCIRNRDIIIDITVNGMGRGAGNLNSEIYLNHLVNKNDKYTVKPLLYVMDAVIDKFYRTNPWGYNLPNYLSAKHNIHPKYSSYLCNKDTLNVDAMDDIFMMMDETKRIEYDAKYIEKLYIQYMSKGKNNDEKINELMEKVRGRKIILVAPGKSASLEKETVKNFIETNAPLVISINHMYDESLVDFIFLANMRRLELVSKKYYSKLIITSNILRNVLPNDVYARVDYYSLLNSFPNVTDNAGLMCIQFMINLGCQDLYLVGFDGYDYYAENNYDSNDLILVMSRNTVDALNDGMKEALREFSKQAVLNFLTKPRVIDV